MTHRIGLIITCFFFLLGCSNRNNDDRLIRIANIVSESPDEALCSLDSINYHSLSKDNQYLYDFLTIKAKDKAYIQHTSDSGILKVIKYYSGNKKDTLYAEALYYGGRVYSDLGDQPTALQYFQKSLDQLNSTKNHLKLKYTVLSQTGRLLTSLRLFDESIPYIKSTIDIEKQLKDTLHIIYDLQLLGGTYLRAGNYSAADTAFHEALKYCTNVPAYHTAKTKMYLASVKYYQGDLDSALLLIRNTQNEVISRVRNSVLGYASNIYLNNNILDSAFLFAHELINSPDKTNKEIGYQVILAPKIRKNLDLDTIDRYIAEYRDLLENYYDENQSQLAISQQSMYNYQIQQREREKTEAYNKKLIVTIFIIVFFVLILIIIILYLKNRNKSNLLKLHIAIDNINKLKQRLNLVENNNEADSNHSSNHLDIDTNFNKKETTIVSHYHNTTSQLREELRNSLLSVYQNNSTVSLSHIILKSPVYHELQNKIKNGAVLQDEDIFWEELEKLVIQASPEFKINLQLLTGGKLTATDLHTSLLIKCHVTPSQMSSLLSRTKGAIASRRESLCFRVFDKKLGTKVIDGIIRLL